MSESIEQVIIYNLLIDEEYTRKVIPYVKEEYFDDPAEKSIYKIIHSFFNKFNNLPTLEAIGIELSKTKLSDGEIERASEILESFKKTVQPPDEDWLIENTEQFCQDKALWLGLSDSISIYKGQDKKRDKGAIPQILTDALGVCFDDKVGHDHLDDAEARYIFLHKQSYKIPFDLEELNKITKGGIERKTLNLIMGGTGCHAKGSPILLSKGYIKNVEDIKKNDFLIGDDGSIRTVQSLIRGKGKMYELKINSTGEKYTFNEDHILSLIHTTKNTKIEISIKEYLKQNDKFKYLHKIYFNSTVLEFRNEKILPIDPYFMGLYLGDGHTRTLAVTTMDKEIVKEIKKQAKKYGLKVRKQKQDKNKASSYFISNKKRDSLSHVNVLMEEFRDLGLKFGNYYTNEERTICSKKFIPDCYKFSTSKNRLELLAGLIDTDGYRCGNSYSISSSSKQLIEDVIFISRSLGLFARFHKKYNKKHKKFYFWAYIKPNNNILIPVRLKRKYVKKNNPNKDILRSSFKINYVGIDNFYGFNLDGNKLYTMGNFLVTHNSGKTIFACHCAAHYLTMGLNVLYITLEMAEEKICQRIDMNLLGVDLDQLMAMPKENFLKRIDKLKETTQGKLVVKEYPTGGAHTGHFRHLANELKLKRNFIPDVIIVDYINICASSRLKRSSGSAETSAFIKSVAEELRAWGVEMNVPIWSPTQFNREGYENTDPSLKDIGESWGLAQTADFIMNLVPSSTLAKLKQIMIKQGKNRYFDEESNRRFILGLDKNKMKFFNVEASAQQGLADMEGDVPMTEEQERLAISKNHGSEAYKPGYTIKRFGKDKKKFEDIKV
jgi:replicative DNA helicase